MLEEAVLKFKSQWMTQDVGGAMTVGYLQRKSWSETGSREDYMYSRYQGGLFCKDLGDTTHFGYLTE